LASKQAWATRRASVIIPAWNGRPYLAACLDALEAQEPADFEIIVVDNASTDGSADYVAEKYTRVHPARVRLIRNRDNLGFAGACNAGIRVASGEILVLLNQDTEVYPGWLDALIYALRDPKVGVVGGKALYPGGETIQHAGGRIEWPVGIAYHYGMGERDSEQWNVPRSVDYVTGAAMAFRRDVLDRVGLLDEGFWPGYYEDADFCFRVRATGQEIWYLPGAVMIHKESPSLSGMTSLHRYLHRGRLRFVLKHLPPQRFLSEFVPAEQVFRQDMQEVMADSLRMVYLESIPVAGSLVPRCWRTDARTIRQVLSALRQLYLASPFESEPYEPALQELDFRSDLPAIGPLVARLRSLWYGVAARWAVRHLKQQQEVINRQQKSIDRQQELLNQVYVRSLITLSLEIANLSLGQQPEEEHRADQGAGEERS
jgi:GT2 family glycosyltransferase